MAEDASDMKRMDTINVIPFIDIMLVLLAIVLTTATFLVEGRLDIRLPKAAPEARPEVIKRVEIGIGRNGEYYLDAAPAELGRVASHLSGLEPQAAIILRVDAQAQFERFVAVVDLLKARGMERVSIVTRDQ
jgi:biopolymer transport protein ExbD